jgi:hypothetical protein
MASGTPWDVAAPLFWSSGCGKTVALGWGAVSWVAVFWVAVFWVAVFWVAAK